MVVKDEKKKTGKTKEIGGESTTPRILMKVGESEICQTCPATESENEIIVPITVMKSGVYNSSLRTAEVVSRSTQLWEGIPIILERVNGTAEHPTEGIVTSLQQVVGQLRDVYWDDSNGRIRGNGHFSEALGASPELIYSLVSGEKPGVSGAYFRDGTDSAGEWEGQKYRTVVENILPNNLAIVDNPACKECRINMESSTVGIDTIVDDNTNKNRISRSEIRLEELNMVDEIKNESKIVIDELKIQLESTKKVASERDMEITGLKAKIAEMGVEAAASAIKIADFEKKFAEIALESKKVAFISQFPVDKREAATKELLEPFLADAAGFVVRHGARFAELLTVEAGKPAPRGNGKEFTPELDSEEKEYQALGVPSLEKIKAQLGVA